MLTHGLQSGDVAANGGIVWARADRASRLVIEASTTENFSDICCTTFADALPESDFTAKVLLGRFAGRAGDLLSRDAA